MWKAKKTVGVGVRKSGAGGGGAGGVEGQQEDHPLLNNCILSNMFEVVPKGQLSSLRLVCKSWHAGSLSRFQNSVTVSTNLSSAIKRASSSSSSFVNVVKRGGDELGVELLEPYNNLTNNRRAPLLFRNFRFTLWDLRSYQLGQSFWSNCGAWMRSLTLEHCRILAEDVQALDQLLFQRTPNLEILKLQNVTFARNCYRKYHHADEQSDQRNDGVPQRQHHHHQSLRSMEIRFHGPFQLVFHSKDVSCLLSKHRFPNLRKLVISTQRNVQLENETELHRTMVRNKNCSLLETLFKSMADIRGQQPSTLAITHLEITGLFYKTDKLTKISEETAALLEKLRWPLRSLTLDVGAATKEQVLQKVLSSCSSTLVKLELHRNDGCAGAAAPYQNFPFGVSMPCLQVLKTRGRFLPRLATLKHFPNLRALEVEPNGEIAIIMDDDDPEQDMNFVLPHLITLKIQGFHPGSPGNMRILASCMPILEEISGMQANCHTFPELCSLWRNTLRKLELSVGPDVDETVVIGIRRSVGVKWRGSKGNITRRPANITDLIHLQELRINRTAATSSKSFCTANYLADLAFDPRFRQLPNLRCLKLFDAPEMNMGFGV